MSQSVILCVAAAFNPNALAKYSEYSVYCMIRMAIGDYFLRDKTPSRYRGKRGTWENQEANL